MNSRMLFAGCLVLLTACKVKDAEPTDQAANRAQGGGLAAQSENRAKDNPPTVEPPPEMGQVLPAGGPRSSGRLPPALWLQPGDLMTSTGETPIQVLLDSDGPVDPTILSSIVNTVQLQTYPELAIVPVTISAHNPEVYTTPVDTPKGAVPPPVQTPHERAYVELRPKSKLRESWYVLSLSKMPAGVRVVPWGAPTPPVGAYAVRFHTGSRPTLTRVLFCKKDSGAKTVFEFSENVQGEGIQSVGAIDQPSTGKSCAYTGSGPQPNTSMRWLHLSCDNFAETEQWRINLAPGLSSPSGAPLTTFDGRTSIQQNVDIATLPDSGDGCRVWRP